jgi:hypothetical protein
VATNCISHAAAQWHRTERESRERVFHSRPAIYILLFLSAGKKLRLGRLEFPYWDGHAKYANQSHAVYTPGLSKPNKRQQLLFNLRRSRYFFSARAAISCWLIKRIYSRRRACFFGNNWTREREKKPRGQAKTGHCWCPPKSAWIKVIRADASARL